MASSSADGNGGGDRNLLDESVSNFEFPDSLDGFGLGGQSPMAQSIPLPRSFSINIEGREALNNHAMVLDLLQKQMVEKDRQIEELKQEKAEIKEEVRESKAEQRQMNQRFERLQSERQVNYTSYCYTIMLLQINVAERKGRNEGGITRV